MKIFRSRMVRSFLINVAFISLLDLVAFVTINNNPLTTKLLISIDYAPEVWFALLAIVLGTLIIVISIASQSIIKLIDLYMKDWISLLYIWFMILCTFHVILIYDARPSSHFLNVNIFLLLSLLGAFPYVFYILRLTKPEVIISRIHDNWKDQIHRLTTVYEGVELSDSLVRFYQKEMFSALNQLDDLLTYVQFKETRSQILSVLRQVLCHYLENKSKLPHSFSTVTNVIASDISFRTMSEAVEEMDHYDLFFEKKCLRMLGNAYILFVSENQFDLASVCASELVKIGATAVDRDMDDISNLMLVHFNTFFRFAFKNALKENEQRNLYNLVYHYRLYIERLVSGKKDGTLIQSFFYLQFYGCECFKNASKANLHFIVDTIAFEMKKILILVHEKEFDKEVQLKLLNFFLQVDHPPEMIDDEVSEQDMMLSKVRMVQASMGLFYMDKVEHEFMDLILDDFMDDMNAIGKEKFIKMMDKLFFLLGVFGPTFWEDTDRGDLNIYFTENKDQIDLFKSALYERVDLHLQASQ